MQVDRSCRFLVQVLREPSGELLVQESLGELGFLADEARFLAVSGKLLPDEPQLLRAKLEPIRPADGGPRLEGIRVTLRHRDPARAPFVLEAAPRVAAGRGAELAALLCEEGILKEGDRYRARLAAEPLALAAPSTLFGDRPGEMEIHEESFPVRVDSLAERGIGPSALAEADPARPVFVPRKIIAAAQESAVRHGAEETGFLLLGHLVEDRRADSAPGPAAWAVVFTEKVDVPDGRGTAASFTFPPEAFRAARRLAAGRGRREEVLGSQHSHGWAFKKPDSVTQNQCTEVLRRPSGAEEREAACRGRRGGGSASPTNNQRGQPDAAQPIFFSAQDERMARLFPVYSAFLVAGRDAERDQDRPSVACFVRRGGSMRAVPFGVYE